MVLKIEDHLIVNMQLLKITGLNQLLNPHVRKFFGFNIFIYVLYMMLVIIIIAILLLFSNMCYCLENIPQAVEYFSLFVSGIILIIKMYCFIQNSEQIWNCIHLTSIHSLCYEYHNRQILESGRTKSKSLSLVFILLWLVIAILWMLSPFIFSNYYIEVNGKSTIYYYHLNVLNLYFPANDKFYNENFLTYYCIESIITICWAYSLLIFDIILMSMCVAFLYQLRTIGNSYSTFGDVHNHSKSKL